MAIWSVPCLLRLDANIDCEGEIHPGDRRSEGAADSEIASASSTQLGLDRETYAPEYSRSLPEIAGTVAWEPIAHPKITEKIGVFARAFLGFVARLVFENSVDEVGSNARAAKTRTRHPRYRRANFLLSFPIRNTPAHPS